MQTAPGEALVLRQRTRVRFPPAPPAQQQRRARPHGRALRRVASVPPPHPLAHRAHRGTVR